MDKDYTMYMLKHLMYDKESYRNINSSEIDYFDVDIQNITKGISLCDWHMQYNTNVIAQKRDKAQGDEMQIIFFINQDLSWEIKDQKKSIYAQKGEVCIYRNDFCRSSTYYPAKQEFKFKSIQIPVIYFKDILQTFNEESQSKNLEKEVLKEVTKLKISQPMYRILNEIDQAKQYGTGIRKVYLEGKVLELLAIYFNEMGLNHKRSIYSMTCTDREAVDKAKEILDKDIINVPTCELLAHKVHMSRAKLTKLFSLVYGMPIHTYVINRRLEYAAMLLTEKKVNVSQAAMLCGYSNMSHFSASFKKKYGVLPSTFN